MLTLRPTPNLEDQGVTLCLVSTLRPVRHGWPYQEYKTPADIALGVIETHKPLHHDKVVTPFGADEPSHSNITLIFCSEEDFTDTDSVKTGTDSPELADSVPDKDNLRIVLGEMETVDSLKMRMSLRLLIPAVNFHILHNKKELRPEDIVGDLRTPEQGNWRNFAVILHLT
ncbi:hypothetical protein ACROYT_G043867 [Oculina patagonica]